MRQHDWEGVLPRLQITSGELADTRALIRERLATRPTFGAPLGQRQPAGVA